MANYIEVRAQKRSTMIKETVNKINEIGQDNIISVIMDEGGKLAGGSVFASIRSYIIYKD